MYLQDPPDDAAVTAVYAAAEADAGYVMNYVRGWAWRPDVAAAFTGARSALASETALGARDIAVINTVVARARGGTPTAGQHGGASSQTRPHPRSRQRCCAGATTRSTSAAAPWPASPS